MHALRTVNSEPLPGYRLLQPLGSGGFGEVWMCEAPGGLAKAVKFVTGSDDLHGEGGAQQEWRALQHVKSIRHPFLLSVERVEQIGNDLVIVMELADKSLHDLLEERRKAGEPGLPRRELLSYLVETAEVLDLMNHEHGLQHLDVKPRNLFLMGRHIKVADFGLVNSLAELHGAGLQPGAITPLYAAPETFVGQVSLHSDQYSLALTYHELLTGALPFDGKNYRQLLLQHTQTEPDLSRLPAGDRPVVARALSKQSRQRYPSCSAFVKALLDAPDTGPVSLPRTTAFDIGLGDLSATAIVCHTNSPGRTTGPPIPPEAPPPKTACPEGVLPGYKFLECVGRSPGGEVWHVRAPDGGARLLKFITPGESAASRRGVDPVQRLRALRHPALARLEVLPAGPGRLALVSEVGQFSLTARLREYQGAGQPGVPRHELLGYLRSAAEALDQLRQQYSLHHLSLSPRQLTVRDGELLMLDFALTELFWVPGGLNPGRLNARHAAPELFDGQVSPTSDQYSLALIYQEILVGLHPFRNLNGRQLAAPRLRGQPDLALLPAPDRPILRQALHADPGQRFRSCTELIDALEAVSSRLECGPTVSRPPSSTRNARPVGLPPSWRSPLDELVRATGQPFQVRSVGNLHYLLAPGQRIQQRTWGRVVPETARLKLGGFREQWEAQVVARSPGRFIYELRLPGSLLQLCMGRVPTLRVEVRLGAPSPSNGSLSPVLVTIEPDGCGRGKAEQALEEVAPHVLSSLHTYLQTHSERADQERYPFAQKVSVRPVRADGSTDAPIPARGVAIAATGLELLTPGSFPLAPVVLELPRWASPLTIQVPARVVACEPWPEGGHRIEARFGE
jgi:serine/threonine protein kinase